MIDGRVELSTHENRVRAALNRARSRSTKEALVGWRINVELQADIRIDLTHLLSTRTPSEKFSLLFSFLSDIDSTGCNNPNTPSLVIFYARFHLQHPSNVRNSIQLQVGRLSMCILWHNIENIVHDVYRWILLVALSLNLRPFRHRLTYYCHFLHVQLINKSAKVADVARSAFLQERHRIFLVK
jgi:hypothetical protein